MSYIFVIKINYKYKNLNFMILSIKYKLIEKLIRLYILKLMKIIIFTKEFSDIIYYFYQMK